MSNYNETEGTFGKKFKKFCSNRAVIVTALTLLLAVSILVAVTVSANRAKQQIPSTGETSTETQATPSGKGEETLPTYNEQETQPVVNEPEAPTYVLPVSGKLAKDHDPSLQVYSATMGDYRVHLGLDIATEVSAPVCAVADGTVKKVWEDSLMGMCVAVEHSDDTVSIYKNLSKVLADGIREGAAVKSGVQLGTVGDTAILEMADEPHLHFEMTVGGLAVDPMEYFSKDDAATLSKDTAFESSANQNAGK